MHLLITDSEGNKIVRKKSAIRNVYTTVKGETFVCFDGSKNTPIKILETPEDFFNLHLNTRPQVQE